MAFYDEMQTLAKDLLKPDTAGGLGQGAITLTRTVPGTPDPETPWIPVPPVKESETFDQISTADAQYTQAGTIIVTDLAYMLPAHTTLDPAPGDEVSVNGVHTGGVVHVEPFPAHGVRVYTLIYVNR